MWRAVVMLVLLAVTLFVLVRGNGTRESFAQLFPDEIPVGFGETAHLVDESLGTEVSGEYDVDPPSGSDAGGLPEIMDYQQQTGPQGDPVLTGGTALTDEGIPLVYVASGFEGSVVIDPINVQDDTMTAEQETERIACAGYWYNNTCNFEDDDCSDGEQVSLWKRNNIGNFVCELQEACNTGVWNGTGCDVEGDVCSTDAQIHVYVRDGDQLVCVPQEQCDDSAWYSKDARECVPFGDPCTINGQEGRVESRQGELYCQLAMTEKPGYRLNRVTPDDAVVDSEHACYEICTKMAGGCGAYTYDSIDKTCMVAGLSSHRMTTADDTTKTVFTPQANLHPAVDIKLNETKDSVVVKWEPFNTTDFEMRYGEDILMNTYDVVAANGAIMRGVPGQTLYFQPFYKIGEYPAAYMNRTVVFAEGEKEFEEVTFDTDPEDGPFFESIEIVWRFTLPDDMTLMIKFPNSASPIRREAHGRRREYFDSPGDKEFECWVYRDQELIHTKKVVKTVQCLPSKILTSDNKCAYYEILAFSITTADMTAKVTWNIRTADNVFVTLKIGDDPEIALDTSEAGEQEMDLEFVRPRTTEAILFVKHGEALVHTETSMVTFACAADFVDFNGEKCVERCVDGLDVGVWRHNDEGECELECPEPYHDYNGLGVCVLKRGEPCNGATESDEYGEWKADGAGGCDLVCARSDYEVIDNRCYQECPPNKPVGSEFYWTEDTRECDVRCTEPDFSVSGNRCLQDCAPLTGADSLTSYYNYTLDGHCDLKCYDTYVKHDGRCVPQSGQTCGQGAVQRGAYKTDGTGGCVLRCDPGFRESADDPGKCKQECPASPPFAGASWIHGSDLMCVPACNDPENMYIYQNACVLKENLPCDTSSLENPDVGTYISDGRGGCTRTCEAGYDLIGTQCVKNFAVAYFTATVHAANKKRVDLSWDIVTEPGMSLELKSPEEAPISISGTGTATKEYSAPGRKDFLIYVYRNGTKDSSLTQTAQAVVACDPQVLSSVTQECVDVDSPCGTQPPSGNGRRYIDPTGSCVLLCSAGYSQIADNTDCSLVATARTLPDTDTSTGSGSGGVDTSRFSSADAVMITRYEYDSAFGIDRSDRIAYSTVPVNGYTSVVSDIRFMYNEANGKLYVGVNEGGAWSYLHGARSEDKSNSTDSFLTIGKLSDTHYKTANLDVWVVPQGVLQSSLASGGQRGLPQVNAVFFKNDRHVTMRDGVISIYGLLSDTGATVDLIHHDGTIVQKDFPITMSTSYGNQYKTYQGAIVNDFVFTCNKNQKLNSVGACASIQDDSVSPLPPTAPTQPTTQTAPTQPTTPTAPTQPTTPTAPTQPTTPTAPPTAPSLPVEPQTPTITVPQNELSTYYTSEARDPVLHTFSGISGDMGGVSPSETFQTDYGWLCSLYCHDSSECAGYEFSDKTCDIYDSAAVVMGTYSPDGNRKIKVPELPDPEFKFIKSIYIDTTKTHEVGRDGVMFLAFKTVNGNYVDDNGLHLKYYDGDGKWKDPPIYKSKEFRNEFYYLSSARGLHTHITYVWNDPNEFIWYRGAIRIYVEPYPELDDLTKESMNSRIVVSHPPFNYKEIHLPTRFDLQGYTPIMSITTQGATVTMGKDGITNLFYAYEYKNNQRNIRVMAYFNDGSVRKARIENGKFEFPVGGDDNKISMAYVSSLSELDIHYVPETEHNLDASTWVTSPEGHLAAYRISVGLLDFQVGVKPPYYEQLGIVRAIYYKPLFDRISIAVFFASGWKYVSDASYPVLTDDKTEFRYVHKDVYIYPYSTGTLLTISSTSSEESVYSVVSEATNKVYTVGQKTDGKRVDSVTIMYGIDVSSESFDAATAVKIEFWGNDVRYLDGQGGLGFTPVHNGSFSSVKDEPFMPYHHYDLPFETFEHPKTGEVVKVGENRVARSIIEIRFGGLVYQRQVKVYRFNESGSFEREDLVVKFDHIFT